MMSFKTFLAETPELHPEWSTWEHEKRDRPERVEHAPISVTPSGHTIRSHSTGYSDSSIPSVSFSANKDGKNHVMVSTMKYGDEHRVGGLKSSPGSTLKAHDFYHHLITHHGVTLVSDNVQSVGGMKVWHKLSGMPGISMKRRESVDASHEDGLREPFEDNYSGFNAKSVLVARKA